MSLRVHKIVHFFSYEISLFYVIIFIEVDKMDYVAIDFETANSNLTSTCGMGIVCIKNNQIYEEWHSLINPQEEFAEFNIFIHKITPEDVENEKTIIELWPTIYNYLNNQIVVCHNANFDINIIKACANKYNLPMPKMKIGCTLRLARKLWKEEVINHRLNTLAKYLEVELNHHNALSDARVCHYIIKRGLRMYRETEIENLYHTLGLKLKVV